MRRSTCSALAVLLIALTCTNALSVKPKSPSEPVKANNHIMKSIDQLVKAFNEPDIQPKVLVEPVSSRGIVSESVRRRLDGDHSKIPKAKAQVPDPVQISSSPIRINTHLQGGKRSRSLGEEDGVRTIEGVRTPDTEEDKVKTWRNARVIKGFLVPKDRETKNPHKKRQIYVQDATQFLASQGLIPQQTTLIDGSSYQTAAANQQMYYTPQPQQTQYIQQQDGSLYGTAAPVQIQTVTAVPFTQQQTGQGQMYVLQADGTSYAPYNPVSFSPSPKPSKSQFVSRAGEIIQTATEQIPQASVNIPAQVAKPQVSIISKASPHHLQVQQPSRAEQKAAEQKQEKLNQQQIQFQQAQQVLQQVQKQVEQQQAIELRQLQELQAQQQAEQQFQQLQQLQQAAQLQQQQQQQQAAQIQQQQAAQIQHQQAVQIQQQQQAAQIQQQVAAAQLPQNQQQTILIPQGGSTLIQAQVQHDQQQQQQPVAQIFQVQQPQQQQPQIQTMFQAGNGQTYILNHSPAPDTFEERASAVTQSPSQFIIKPQTYITGPGGQAFTVPVPIPSEQDNSREHIEHHQQRRPQQHSGEEPDSGERRPPSQRRRDRERDHDDSHKRPTQTFMNRIMDAFTVKGNAMERVETNIALPVLATTGVFFGLGALAAGWFLSSANREVGILRRTGKPVAPGMANIKRIRRSTQGSEVDQATFFQSIIQQAIEKQQKEYDEEPEVSEAKPSPAAPLRNKSPNKGPQRVKPSHSRNDYQDEHYDSQIEKVSHKPIRKSGFWLGSRQALNFAKVAIPAIILGGAVLAIGALIFGWYISGSNREIAFLEPSAYSRRKRDLTTTALSDGWLQRLLNSIHENPYESGASNSITNTKDSVFDPDTSKHSLEYHANLSDAVVAVSLAVVAFFSLMGIVLAWFFSENEKSNLGITGPYGFGGWPGNNYRSSRTRRSVSSNDLAGGPHLTHNPSFLESILTNLEVSQNSILHKLQETGYAKWQETPCAKRIFCDVMAAQSDDTVRAMEKRMSTFISMLPDSLSSSLSRSLGEVIMSIQRRDCSSYTCGGHWVDSSIIDQPSPPTNHQPR